MKRSIIAGGLAISLLLTTACGDDEDSETEVAATTEAEATTATTEVEATTATTRAPGSTAATTATTGAVATTAATSAVATSAAATTVATSAAAIVPGADPDVDAVVAAYGSVFDSSVPYEQKAVFLPDADALRPTIDAYAQTGQRFGGIKLVPTAVTITGDEAAVTYDVLFGTTTQYSGLPGKAVRQDGTWTVTRDEFCSFMASARTPCPSA